jgi:gliding motility associated protien GldN
MKQLIIIFTIAIAGLMNISSFAQGGTILNPEETPRDGYYDKIHFPSRRVVPYAYLREADVMYTRRVWRKIDLREKINQPMFFPKEPTNLRKNLIFVIREAVVGTETKPATVKGYDAFSGDDFKVVMTVAEIKSIGSSADTTQIQYPFPPYDFHDTVFVKNFDPGDVTEYNLKEDWYFDKQRSVMEPRIIGICPRMKRYDATGALVGMQPMCWVYFPELRKELVNEEVYNPYNFGARITYDDLFMKRQFNSLIYKVDNTYDRQISEYTKGIDALLEAENIKDIIFKFEHDVWEQ